VVVGAVAGCSGSGDDANAEGTSGTEAETTISLPESRTPTTIEDGTFLVAQASEPEINVWDEPGDPDDFDETLKAIDESSGILTFLVQERTDDGWLKVELPTPPLGSTGFIPERDVVLTRHRFEIEISRSAHTLKVLANGLDVFDNKVAIGPDAPPADTHTYIKEALLPPEGSMYNPRAYAYGLAGAANSPQDFADGQRVMAIHAVANPATLGHDAPTGSIGMDVAVLRRLYEDIKLPLGTPVRVVG
jgi:hypothetical protein